MDTPGSGYGPLDGCCVYSNDTRKGREFFERASDIILSKRVVLYGVSNGFDTLPVFLPSGLRSRPLPHVHSLLSARLPQSTNHKVTTTQANAKFNRMAGVLKYTQTHQLCQHISTHVLHLVGLLVTVFGTCDFLGFLAVLPFLTLLTRGLRLTVG